MSHDGLLGRVIAVTGNEHYQAFKAIAAALLGQLDLALPPDYEGHPVVFSTELTVHKPPPVEPLLRRANLKEPCELITYISETAGISEDAASKVLGLVTESFVGKSFEAGLRFPVQGDAD